MRWEITLSRSLYKIRPEPRKKCAQIYIYKCIRVFKCVILILHEKIWFKEIYFNYKKNHELVLNLIFHNNKSDVILRQTCCTWILLSIYFIIIWFYDVTVAQTLMSKFNFKNVKYKKFYPVIMHVGNLMDSNLSKNASGRSFKDTVCL